MIAADTNLVVRHLTQDDARQAAIVRRLFSAAEARREPIFLGHIVLCEVSWTLASVYGMGRPEIGGALAALLDDDAFLVENRAAVAKALGTYRRGSGGFADYLIGAVAEQQGATTTLTFDRKLARADGFTLAR